MKKFDNILEFVIRWILIVLMAVIVLDVVWQVLTRFVLNDPSSFTEELAIFLLIWISLLGSAYALRKKAHLGIDILSNYVSEKQKKVLDIIINSIVILICLLVFVVGGIRLMYITLKLNQISPALQIKMGYIYSVLPLTGLLMIYYSVAAIFNNKAEENEVVEDI
ncbi:TRAP transporter small permease [candidate division KSB1 bacterium]